MMEILNKTCRLCLAVQEEGKELILLKIVEKQKIKFEELTNVEVREKNLKIRFKLISFFN